MSPVELEPLPFRRPDAPIPHYSVEQFDWTARRGKAKLSDFSIIGSLFSMPVLASRVWAELPDIGFIVRNLDNGREVLFTQARELGEGEDGEVQGWVFESRERQFTITIIND